MNLGLGNLIELKRQLLPAALQAGTTYDTVITKLGQGVAAQFNKHCNRLFERAVGCTDLFSADRDHWFLRRYPVETITTLEQRDTVSAGWETLTVNDVVQQRRDEAGYIYFAAAQGVRGSELRCTYTGGYWFDTAESEDTAQPAGTTALPADVRQAWYVQCRHVWESIDKLGTGIAKESDAATALGSLDLVPSVKQTLQHHIRYALT